MRRYTIFLISLALLAVACKAGKSSFQSEVVNGEESRKQWQEIPSVITNVRDRAFYVLRNFWNDVSFKENVLHSQNTELDKKFLTFVRLLSRYPDSSLRRESVNIFVSKVEKSMEVYGYFVEQAEFYLYSPSSPIRDENLYKVVVERFLHSPCCDEMTEARLIFQKTMMSKNNVGALAVDFSYTTAEGEVCTLSEMAKGKDVILLFYSPGCRECENVEYLLANNDMLRECIREERVALLAVYVDGVETIWERCKDDLPDEWISATDWAMVRRNRLYDLKAIPTLYLLDGQQHVVLKDVGVETLLDYLAQRY